MLEPQTQHFVRDFLIFSGFVATHWTFSYRFSFESENRWPQNRRFVRGFRQISSHVTKCHACHGICKLSPLDAALTLRFPKWACNTTRLKCCACHAKWRWRSPKCKMGVVFWKRRKSIAPVTQLWNMLECHKVPRLPLETRLRDVWNLQSDRFCNTPNRHGHSDLIANRCKRLPTVADGCEHKSSVERTRPNPQAPKVKREPFAMHSGKTKSGMAKSTDETSPKPNSRPV